MDHTCWCKQYLNEHQALCYAELNLFPIVSCPLERELAEGGGLFPALLQFSPYLPAIPYPPHPLFNVTPRVDL